MDEKIEFIGNEIELLEDIVHETEHQVGQLLFCLMDSSKIISRQTIDFGRLEEQLATATECANVVKLVTENARLADKDYEANNETKEIRIFDKVFRAYKQIGYRARVKEVELTLQGDSKKVTRIFPCFDMLFYIFLENALKYSPSNMEIEILVQDEKDACVVTIESVGPKVLPAEEPKLTDRKFRGENAIKVVRKGRGLGLHTAKKICELHDVELKFFVRDPTFQSNGTDHCTFVVQAKVPSFN
ncbi:ATP-binding protein [Amylibacter sp. IMCC11727]|uniref:sensor histidine kinase n=1 Tax=Amylibacter sp. IMCC11727 TaxID=3039851 RepID=UPI00244DB909|nr:ATP-binding protein [Amylibacter sp. IMCC11727]WGI20794.1 ATP-binding protein [Amylibacter sp. IMCC11727]